MKNTPSMMREAACLPRFFFFFFVMLLPFVVSGAPLFYVKEGNKRILTPVNQFLPVKNMKLQGYKTDKGAIVYPDGDIFVKLACSADSPGIIALFHRYRITVKQLVPYTGTLIVSSSENPISTAAALTEDPCVIYAEPDFWYQIGEKEEYIPDDPFFFNQWYLYNYGQEGVKDEDAGIAAAWAYLMDRGLSPGKNVAIGIIDDGFDLNHEDLHAHFASGYDFYADDPVPFYEGFEKHGTCVAGIAGAIFDNGKGVAGAAPFSWLIPVRLSSDIMNAEKQALAFSYLIERNVDIISNSWGPVDKKGAVEMPEIIKELVEYARYYGRNGKGIVILFAAGNGNEDISAEETYDGYAANPNVIAVGATNASGVRAMYSDFGDDLDIMAPSCDYDPDETGDPYVWDRLKNGIWTTDITGYQGYMPWDYQSLFCGTSAAAPLAAGVVALLIGANPDLDWNQIYTILTGTARKVSPHDAQYDKEGFSRYYGYGRIDARQAVAAACETGCTGILEPRDEENYPYIDVDTIDIPDESATTTDAPMQGPILYGCDLITL